MRQMNGAVQEELDAHSINGTWVIVQKTSEIKPIDSKWVFKVMTDTSGNISRYKARLVARGFMQKEGRDYTETFAPVVRYDSVRTFLAIVALEDLEMSQFDVRTAFLYGDLPEDIYMEIPEGLKESTDSNKTVCKLKKSLYGLKQAPRCWNIKFNEFLTKFNLKPSDADQCIYQGKVHNTKVLLALFVDDGLIAAKTQSAVNAVIDYLRTTFEITIGDGHYFAGIEEDIVHSSDSLYKATHQELQTNRNNSC